MADHSVEGTLAGITEKPSGWTEIQVSVPGKQYPVKMSTKRDELVVLARAAGTAVMTWFYNETESENINPHTNQPYRNKYFEGVEPAGSAPKSTGSVATPAAAPKAAADAMTKDEWARKDSAIHKMACIKTAADALKHTVPSDPTPEDLATFMSRVLTLSLAWHRSVLAERDDPTGEDIPF